MHNIDFGIYIIKNIKNNKVYVGSTVNIKRRKRNHFWDLKNNKHDNDYLQKSYNKYGKENFIFEVIEYVEDKSKLLEREQFWIDKLNVCDRSIGYNICKIAGNTLGQIFSDEAKKKKSKSMKKYFKENDNAMLGRRHSEESIQKMRDNKKNKVKIINIETKEIFNSAAEAGRKYGVTRWAIQKCCAKISKMSAGYKWEYC